MIYDEANEKELNINYHIEILEIKIKASSNNLNVRNRIMSQSQPPSILPSNISKTFDILEWSEIEIARQLTLTTYFLFKNIRIEEFFSQKFNKEDKNINSPNIIKMIERFNNLTYWIVEEILSYDHKKTRSKVIFKFLKIAKECQKINNFNDSNNIFMTLKLLVFPLKKTMELVHKNSEADCIYNELDSLFSLDKNYANLRKEIKCVSKKACIPFLPLILNDLSKQEEKPNYIKENDLINVDKINKVGQILEEILEFQNNHYDYVPLLKLSFLSDPKPKKQETLDKIAKHLGKINI